MDHQTWTARDGVPPNIEAIVQAPNGLLWIGTDAGLYLFDGVSFRRYVPTSGDAFLSRGFNNLSETRDGSLWLFYSTGGLGRLKDGRLTNFTSTDGAPLGSVSDVVEDMSGLFVIATNNSGLQILNETGTLHTANGKYGNEAQHAQWLAVDGAGNLWILTRSSLYLVPRGSKHSLEVQNAHGLATAMLCPGYGNDIWVERRQGPIVHFMFSNGRVRVAPVLGTDKSYRSIPAENGSGSQVVAEASPPDIASTVISPDGTVWLGTTNGVLRFSAPSQETSPARTQRVETFGKQDGLSGSFAFEGIRDREGSIWFVTQQGLDRFRELPFHTVDTGKRAPVILPHGNPLGDIFVATDCLIDISKNPQRCLPGPNKSWGRSLYRAHDGSLWEGVTDQLRHYRNHRLGLQKLPQDLQGSHFPLLALAEDSKDRLWISIGAGNGAFRLDGKQWVKGGGLTNFPSLPPTAIEQDKTGDLWFAFRNNLIARLHDDQLRTFNGAKGLNLGEVKVLTFFHQQVVAGGEKGVAFLRSGRFQDLVFAEASTPVEVTGLAFAPDESLWVNSSTGVFRVGKTELAQALADSHHAVTSQVFDSKDGVVGIPHEVVGLGSILMAPDRRLYVANRENLQWIDPLHIAKNLVAPEVSITDWKADEKAGSWPTGAVKSNADLKALQIGYTAGSLLVPQRVQFRYRLEGYESAWVDAGTRRTAFFSNVPPGKYVFQVLACNDSGIWSKTGANLSLIVPPTFSQTLVFRSLCALTGLILLTLLYRLRVGVLTKRIQERLYERLSERERIARDLHDTFFQSIQGLLLRFNTVSATLPPASQSRQLLEETLQRSDEVMREGRELLLDLRNNVIEPDNLPAVLADFGRQLQADYDCEFEVLVNGSVQPLNAAVSKEVVGIGKEAVFNAFTHANAHKIEVDLSYERQFLRMSVRDNGKGIDAPVLESGKRDGHYGLPGMKERAAGIGAVFNLWSRPGAGTEVEVRLAAKVALADTRSRRS